MLQCEGDQIVVAGIPSRVEDLGRVIDHLRYRGEPIDQDPCVILVDPLPELRPPEDSGEFGQKLRAHHKIE